MYLNDFLKICFNIIDGSVSMVGWLFTPLDVIGISPIYLITFSGLLVYLVIAIAKWIIA